MNDQHFTLKDISYTTVEGCLFAQHTKDGLVLFPEVTA